MRNRCFNIITLAAALLFWGTQNCFAQFVRITYEWAIASYDENKQEFVALEYKAKTETAANGQEYHRISWLYEYQHDDECRLSRYGFTKRDMRVYLYDFENGEECLCMDYTLQKGETFTTYNGETWEVIETKDTLICDMFYNDEQTRKMLSVRNVGDGRIDKWIEGAGSFINFLMIEKTQPGVLTHVLWVNHDGCYITNEFSADPMFGHDRGWLPEKSHDEEKESSVEYKDGELIIDYWYTAYPERIYECYLRQGDTVSYMRGFLFEPFWDCMETLFNDVIRLKGLPTPASGVYTVNLWDNQLLTTGIHSIGADSPRTHAIFDIQGRKLNAAPAHGIYIKDGVKRYNK